MKTGSYDGKLQMFVQEVREADPERLRFMRWLVEVGQLGHGIAGPSLGPKAATVGAPADGGGHQASEPPDSSA